MRKEITTSLPDEELRAKTIEISSEAAQSEMDKKKSSLGLFLTRVKIFLLKRKKYDIQTLVWEVREMENIKYVQYEKNEVQ